jgi:cyclohexadieny/prephenate dehydrogenase
MPEAEGRVERLALIGVGLIGSSIARAAKRGGLAGHISGVTRSKASRDVCLELGIVDSAYLDPRRAVKDADLVIFCSHLSSYEPIMRKIKSALKPGAIVSDVGSVKACVRDYLGPHLPKGVHLVPGHPVSGTENSGPAAGFAELFDNRWCILTPEPDADRAARCGCPRTRCMKSRCSTP